MDDQYIEWPVEALILGGFRPRDAARLQPLLPRVHVRTVGYLAAALEGGQLLFRHEPAAVVVWAVHNVTPCQAVCLTRAGRGLIDVLVICDAVREHVHYRLSVEGFDVAMDWVRERRVPRHRLARYIALGLPPDVASALETKSGERPSEAALETLAALRRR